MEGVNALVFDVFGTLVDWRTCVARESRTLLEPLGYKLDWLAFADAWRAEYQPAMEEVRSGVRPWTVLDVLHREGLERVLEHHGVPRPSDGDLDDLALAWHRLDPWPDAVAGITALREIATVGTLSNGNTGLLEDLVRNGGLPFHVLLGAETAQTYKPLPQAYLRNVALLGLEPDEVMLAAAHNDDLRAAARCGLRTAFIRRPREHGPHQRTDLAPDGPWDLVVDGIPGVATALRHRHIT